MLLKLLTLRNQQSDWTAQGLERYTPLWHKKGKKMKDFGFGSSIIFVFGFAIVINYFIRVSAPGDQHSTGIIMDFISSRGLLNTFILFMAAIIIVRAVIFVYGYIQGVKKPGVLAFWKLVASNPGFAYQWFIKHPAWHVMDHPLPEDYEQTLSEKDWVGPFDLYVPEIGKRVCIFGRAGEYEHARAEFIEIAKSMTE